MIQLSLDWHEVLWWMQGAMSGSHLRWSVYKDMVNKVWPQCSEGERKNIFTIMRRDLGYWWRPDGWRADQDTTDEGAWKCDKNGYVIDRNNPDAAPKLIHEHTPWMYFRQVLARYNPDCQFAVTLPVKTSAELDNMLKLTPPATIISIPRTPRTAKAYDEWKSDTATITVRAYKWQGEYYIDWTRRCAEDRIAKVEKLFNSL